jgi:hypothetical protein
MLLNEPQGVFIDISVACRSTLKTASENDQITRKNPSDLYWDLEYTFANADNNKIKFPVGNDS